MELIVTLVLAIGSVGLLMAVFLMKSRRSANAAGVSGCSHGRQGGGCPTCSGGHRVDEPPKVFLSSIQSTGGPSLDTRQDGGCGCRGR
jgi:hypothetical protein